MDAQNDELWPRPPVIIGDLVGNGSIFGSLTVDPPASLTKKSSYLISKFLDGQ